MITFLTNSTTNFVLPDSKIFQKNTDFFPEQPYILVGEKRLEEILLF